MLTHDQSIHAATEQRCTLAPGPGLFASVLQALARTAPSMLEASEEESPRLDDACYAFRHGGAERA